MDELLSEQQQAEAIRRWLRANGLWIGAGIVLGLAMLFGWNWWQRHQDNRAEQASMLYEEVVRLAGEGRLDDASASLDRLTGEFDGTIYADQGRLVLARLQLDRNDPNAAAALLKEVADGDGPQEIRDIARLRLARVLIFQEKGDEARAALDKVRTQAYAPLVHETRGDAWFAEGKRAEAAREYELALASPGEVLNRDLVQAKLDDLSVAGSAGDADATAGTATEAAEAADTPAEPAEAAAP